MFVICFALFITVSNYITHSTRYHIFNMIFLPYTYQNMVIVIIIMVANFCHPVLHLTTDSWQLIIYATTLLFNFNHFIHCYGQCLHLGIWINLLLLLIFSRGHNAYFFKPKNKWGAGKYILQQTLYWKC